MQAGDTYHRFSTNCLLAPRLVERGVRFVNIVHASWDQHGNLKHDLAWNCRMADQPVAALLRDLKQRGMLDETLVVWASEFGRTPLGQGNDGRDHYPNAFSMWMGGGGAKGGTVYGQTDEIDWLPSTSPYMSTTSKPRCCICLAWTRAADRELPRSAGQRTNVGGQVIHEVIDSAR